MKTVDPESNMVRETVFVLTEQFPNRTRLVKASRKLLTVQLAAMRMFGANTPETRKGFYWVECTDTGKPVFKPGEGWSELYENGAPTGVRINWMWEL